MPKGIMTQTVCVLTERPVTPAELAEAVAAFSVHGRHGANEEWAFGGPTVALDFRPEVNGCVLVDTVAQPWPDDMGDPKKTPMLFGAWSMGQFGPFTFPGGLARAGQQSWVWEEGRTVAQRHRGFVRVRSTYVMGAGENAPLMPADYDALAELRFVTDVARALLRLPGALCYFNPNGEVLRDAAGVEESLAHAQRSGLPPLDLWANVRLFNVDAGWAVMDTVGNGQLGDLRDVEGAFDGDGGYDYGAIDAYLRDVTLYLLRAGEVINDGDTLDGPGGVRWRTRRFDSSLLTPPRRVYRLLPEDGRERPAALGED